MQYNILIIMQDFAFREENGMKEEMRTIGYLCPACHKRVIQQRSVFALSASGAVVSCDCGQSSLEIEADESKFRLRVPCFVCV